MTSIITPQAWVSYDADPTTNAEDSGIKGPQMVMLNDAWTNILTVGGHKEYKCINADDQTNLKWDTVDGTPFNY